MFKFGFFKKYSVWHPIFSHTFSLAYNGFEKGCETHKKKNKLFSRTKLKPVYQTSFVFFPNKFKCCIIRSEIDTFVYWANPKINRQTCAGTVQRMTFLYPWTNAGKSDQRRNQDCHNVCIVQWGNNCLIPSNRPRIFIPTKSFMDLPITYVQLKSLYIRELYSLASY